MNGHVDVIAVTGKRLVDRVVQHLEYQVMQARAVRRVANVHAGTLAHSLQTLEDLDGGCTIAAFGLLLLFAHDNLPVTASLTDELLLHDLSAPCAFRATKSAYPAKG